MAEPGTAWLMWAADHALGVELELNELVSRAAEARRWHHDREADGLVRDILDLHSALAEIAEHLQPASEPHFRGVRRARELDRDH